MSTTTMPRRGKRLQARRRSELLTKRAAVGAQWADRMSHGFASGRLLQEMATLELTLMEGWPHLSERWVSEWIIADVRRIHGGPEAQMPGCGYCALAQK
ncbi:hypothetical protein [Sanguibacter sp. HDW7]|uniref:hypothetical protein n=1 Tax=Sanguibacter sp. HDW7 TaxID=2714931 RepID=UPI0014081D3A|nr:hypothetical protein [Sanguibacter sp. HDW7]QIK83177.1 hypothetical protein G7063_05690 [Sanguibacter sp. HDW7]